MHTHSTTKRPVNRTVIRSAIRPANRPARLVFGLLAPLLLAGAALAQGTVIIDRPVPHPRIPQRTTTVPLELRYQRISVEITDGVAQTTVQQTFYNPVGRPIEGTYVFPLPDGVAVGEFEVTMAGKTLRGEVLDVDRARRTYEQIVRQTRDPALLEFLGQRLWRASIFPIPAGQNVDIRLQYSQTLTETAGLGAFVHPLARTAQSAGRIEQLSVDVKLRSSAPLSTVFCPSHTCRIERPSEREATVSFEQTGVTPDRDFALYYQRAQAAFGLAVLTHRAAGEPGYFLLRISPRVELDAQAALAKDIAFVVDVSGSMKGEKIAQLRRALKFCVQSLAAEDRFNIYTFSTDVRPFRDGLVPAEADITQAATEFADKLEAVGGTNIHAALAAALAANPGDASRPYLIVFMTDGMPTVEVTEPQAILDAVARGNTAGVRLHVLGIGHDVNSFLLDKLAEANRGSREYCLEGEDLELKISALAERLAKPVLTDLALEIDALKTDDVYPRKLADLFRGNDIVVLGRYDGSGRHEVRLAGRLNSEPRTFAYEAEFPELARENDFLPRLWASRKIAYLLDEIRLRGQNPELRDEVVRLATRYGIVTPYTAALVLEDERQIAAGARGGYSFGAQWRDIAGRAPADQVERGRFAVAGEAGVPAAGGGESPAYGGRGVSSMTPQEARAMHIAASGEIAEGKAADSLSGRNYLYVISGQAGFEQALIRYVGDKAFMLVDGRYVDTAWDGKTEPKRIETLGDEYFELLARHPHAARWLALGERVLVVIEGTPYEVAPPAGAESQPAGSEDRGSEPRP